MIAAWCRFINLLVGFHPKPHAPCEINRSWQGSTLLAGGCPESATTLESLLQFDLQPVLHLK